MPAGTFVTHFGKQIHYDGAKDEESRPADRRQGTRYIHTGGKK